MLPRFLASHVDRTAGVATLGADEAHHLAHVMRLGAGDEVAVFDGHGHEFRARVESVTRRSTQLRLVEAIEAAPEPAVRLTLAQAILKGDKMDGVVRDATMIGAAAIQPIVSDHTIVRRGSDARALERWTRVAVASAKQCRRAVIPEIASIAAFDDLVASDRSGLRLLLAEPTIGVVTRNLATLTTPRPESATLLVGPEGGWSAVEVDAAVGAGWIAITLGRRTLRADAVAIVAIGVLQYVWSDL